MSRQQKKFDKLVGERKSLAGRMSNPRFVESAPEALVASTKARIEEIETIQAGIKELMEKLR